MSEHAAIIEGSLYPRYNPHTDEFRGDQGSPCWTMYAVHIFPRAVMYRSQFRLKVGWLVGWSTIIRLLLAVDFEAPGPSYYLGGVAGVSCRRVNITDRGLRRAASTWLTIGWAPFPIIGHG